MKSFENSVSKKKEMIAYFKDKNGSFHEKYKKLKSSTKLWKSSDTFGKTATTSISVALSVTGTGLIVKQMSTGVAFGLTNSNKVMYKLVMQKYSK